MNDLEGWMLDKRYKEGHDFSNVESKLWSSTTQENTSSASLELAHGHLVWLC